MKIHELASTDIEAAVRLWQRVGLVRPWNPPERDLRRALDGESSTVLGAFLGSRLVGTVMAGDDGHRGWVYYLAVDEGSAGAGLGRRLMAAAEAWLSARGVRKVQLMVRATNTAVLGFYDRLGYEDSDVTVRSKWLVDTGGHTPSSLRG